MQHRPPEEVIGSEVRVRRWRVDDAEALHELVLANLDHLRPWVPWAAYEPMSLHERRSLIMGWSDRWDAGEDFPYAIVDSDGTLLGGCGLHRRDGLDGLEIGYWVSHDRTERGVATSAARALVEAAFSVDEVRTLEIHHDAANEASRRIPEKLGFTRVGEQRKEPEAPAEIGVDVAWRLERERRWAHPA